MVRDVGLYYRNVSHLTNWLMDNFDTVHEIERERLIREILYYKFIIKIMEKGLIRFIN